MKSLVQYLECEGGGGAMPSNTLGAGNPGLVGPSTLSEPLTQGQIDSTPTAKTKKEKKNKSKTKPMKDLKEYLNESLVNESIKQLQVSAYNLPEIIDFAAKFNVNTRNEEEWLGWDDYFSTDMNSDKSFTRKFCKVCKTVLDNVDYGTIELRNFLEMDSSEQSEILKDELDAKSGDKYYFLTADGDNGMFFYIYYDGSNSTKKTIDDFMSMTVGRGNWDWESIVVD